MLDGFETAMREKRLRSYDLADGSALSFVLAYYGLRGEDPGPARLEKLRTDYCQSMMADLAFQGLSDPERQQRDERAAAGPERDALMQRAQQSAVPVLQDLYQKPVDGIELTPGGFGDRGERLAREGGGNFTFRRAPSSQAAGHFEELQGRGLAARLLVSTKWRRPA